MVLPAATANGAAHQVWRVVTADGDGITATYVDAGSGETLRRDELAQEFDNKGPGTSSPAAVASSTRTPWSRCSVKASPTGTTPATP